MEEKTTPNKTIEILESIIFNQEELDALKKKIDQVSKGQLKPVVLRKAILDYRVILFERMQTFLQFNRNLFGRESNNSEDLELQAKYEEKDRILREKNELWESVGPRIAIIYGCSLSMTNRKRNTVSG